MIAPFDLRRACITAVVCCIVGISSFWTTDIQAAPSFDIGYAKFAQGTCTEYVASRRPDLFPSRHGRDRLFGGNAIDWLANAQRAGVPTGTTPQSGAIAVFAMGRGASTSYGHVAIVEHIGDDGTITVSDMNYAGRNHITTRVISSTLALGYIYTLPTADDDIPPVYYIIPTTLSAPDEAQGGQSGYAHPEHHMIVSLPAIIYETIPSSPDDESDLEIALIVADRRDRISHYALYTT